MIVCDLFCGLGGFSRGSELAECEVLAAVEKDETAALAHAINFPKGKTFLADVTEITARDIRQGSKIENNEIDIVTSSPPCQSFSMAGRRDMNDPRSKLLIRACELIVDLNPKYFIIENVKGLTQGKQRQFLTEAIEYLKSRGYQVVEDYQILNARDFGVPQSRERLFLIGSRKGMPLPAYPLPTGNPPPTVREAIGDLPEIEDFPELLEQSYVTAKFGEPSEYVKLLRASEPTEEISYFPNLLTASRRTVHSEEVKARFAQTPPGSIEPVSRFFRLDWNGVSNTLRAGSGSYTAVRPIHPDGNRVISVREAARLSSFDDWMILPDNILNGIRLIGNAVPPRLAQAVIEAIKNG